MEADIAVERDGSTKTPGIASRQMTRHGTLLSMNHDPERLNFIKSTQDLQVSDHRVNDDSIIDEEEKNALQRERIFLNKKRKKVEVNNLPSSVGTRDDILTYLDCLKQVNKVSLNLVKPPRFTRTALSATQSQPLHVVRDGERVVPDILNYKPPQQEKFYLTPYMRQEPVSIMSNIGSQPHFNMKSPARGLTDNSLIRDFRGLLNSNTTSKVEKRRKRANRRKGIFFNLKGKESTTPVSQRRKGLFGKAIQKNKNTNEIFIKDHRDRLFAGLKPGVSPKANHGFRVLQLNRQQVSQVFSKTSKQKSSKTSSLRATIGTINIDQDQIAEVSEIESKNPYSKRSISKKNDELELDFHFGKDADEDPRVSMGASIADLFDNETIQSNPLGRTKSVHFEKGRLGAQNNDLRLGKDLIMSSSTIRKPVKIERMSTIKIINDKISLSYSRLNPDHIQNAIPEQEGAEHANDSHVSIGIDQNQSNILNDLDKTMREKRMAWRFDQTHLSVRKFKSPRLLIKSNRSKTDGKVDGHCKKESGCLESLKVNLTNAISDGKNTRLLRQNNLKLNLRQSSKLLSGFNDMSHSEDSAHTHIISTQKAKHVPRVLFNNDIKWPSAGLTRPTGSEHHYVQDVLKFGEDLKKQTLSKILLSSCKY